MNVTESKRQVILILNATLDDMPMDCCDDDRVHVWVYCMDWSVRRAFITKGSPVLTANGGDANEPTMEAVDALEGEAFYAEFDFPPFEAESGEWIELRNVVKCPPIEEVAERLRQRMTETPEEI